MSLMNQSVKSSLKFQTDRFQALVQNASSYMSQIQNYSTFVISLPIRQILNCLSFVGNFLEDPQSPLMKKLLVLRFLKDTLLKGSLSFYLSSVSKVLPFFEKVLSATQRQSSTLKPHRAFKSMKAGEPSNADLKLSQSVLLLIEEIIIWMSQNCKNHPYSPTRFRSAYKMVLDLHPDLSNSKIKEDKLTFFKDEDSKNYKKCYMRRLKNLEQQKQELLFLVKQVIYYGDQPSQYSILQELLETGDSIFIRIVIDEFTRKLEKHQENPISEEPFLLISLLNKLIHVRDIQFCDLAKQKLLKMVFFYTQVAHKHGLKTQLGKSRAHQLVKFKREWLKIYEHLGLCTQSFDTFETQLKEHNIFIESQSSIIVEHYKHKLPLSAQINQDKIQNLNISSESKIIQQIEKINCIGRSEEIFKSYEQSFGVNKSKLSSKNSHSGSQKKLELQPYSKYKINLQKPPQRSQLNEVNSNLSDLHKKQQTINEKQEDLFMSFKKPSPNVNMVNSQSDRVAFSDTFTSNQIVGLRNGSEGLKAVLQNQLESESIKANEKKVTMSLKEPSNISDYQKPSSFQEDNRVNGSSIYYDYQLKQSSNKPQKEKQKSVSRSSSRSRKIEKSSSISSYKKVLGRVINANSSQNQSEIQNNHQKHRNNSQMQGLNSPKYNEKPIDSRATSNAINLFKFTEEEFYSNKHKRVQSPLRFDEDNAKKVKPVDPIDVEKTVKKPKFSFAKTAEESFATDCQISQIKAQKYSQIKTETDSESSFYPTVIMQQSNESIPSNFDQCLNNIPKNKELGEYVKLNNYDHKVKELQKNIEKFRKNKDIIKRQVDEKEQILKEIKDKMPEKESQIKEENRKLKNIMMNKIKANRKKNIGPESTFSVFKFKSAPVAIQEQLLPLYLKKQLTYSKSRILKNEFLEVGYQTKDNNQLCLYFKLFKEVSELKVKVDENSLDFEQKIEAKVLNIDKGRSIKLKSKILGQKLYSKQFKFAILRVTITQQVNGKRQFQNYSAKIPFHFYNFLKFHPLTNPQSYSKATNWQQCDEIFLKQGINYLKQYFPNGTIDQEDGTFNMIAQNIIGYDKKYPFRVIKVNERFLIEFRTQETEEMKILKCLVSLLSKNIIQDE